jgi:hypothetical protein
MIVYFQDDPDSPVFKAPPSRRRSAAIRSNSFLSISDAALAPARCETKSIRKKERKEFVAAMKLKVCVSFVDSERLFLKGPV